MKISWRWVVLFLGVVILCLAMAGVLRFAQTRKRGSAEVTINGKTVSINYGHPRLKGRNVFALAETGDVWRLGMNQATEITSSGDLVVGGKELKAGKYSLWARKTDADSWVLAFHPKTGIWGEPAMTHGFVAETPLKTEPASDSAELLLISLAEVNGQPQITIHWGKASLVGSFGVK
ncbi:MAG: DUF2911 domain-containing protein [Acidobacteriia bacterium]|nr:DUF2911 domain-containing protein [Terriglobia bacterium]